jgi:phosphoribosylglycinamide formyltransferase 2
MQKKILLLGSGELGKELVIACKRLGQIIIAVDSYPNAPAMQLADGFEVIDMLDGEALDKIVIKHQPDIIVPEVEAIRTIQFYKYEQNGIQVVPSARAANFTMDRRAIRDLAAHDLELKTPRYFYADNVEDYQKAVEKIGFPFVIKPLMSSSGKGQSIVKDISETENAWRYAMEGSRGDIKVAIIEEFIHFYEEITILTVTQKEGPTLFCPPIGHRQERGDYMESWQPCVISASDLKDAQEMAAKVTHALGGAGIWGVEFFLTHQGVYFSELSPRPHDTGMVTLANSQNFNEFELHARAILGLNIPHIQLEKAAASAVILASKNSVNPIFSGLEEAAKISNSDFKLFGKPTSRPFRRMGVALAYDTIDTPIDQIRARAAQVANLIEVNG